MRFSQSERKRTALGGDLFSWHKQKIPSVSLCAATSMGKNTFFTPLNRGILMFCCSMHFTPKSKRPPKEDKFVMK
jgi:hypothetical protein